MPSSGRLRRTLRNGVSALLISIAVAWLSLYFDSILQRRKAERLVADLKTFPFATAGFIEVRDLVVKYGGHAVERLPEIPPMTCSVTNCTFELSLQHRLLRLPVREHTADVVFGLLSYVGIRPWVVAISFEVKDGKLEGSITQVGQLKMGVFHGERTLDPIGYDVRTEQAYTVSPAFRGHIYSVGRPIITGPPEEILETRILQVPDAPTNRAFDINTRCFTSILHGCRSFADLAPSAWADHERLK